MRRIPAIVLVFTLLMAPLALLANGASIARYENQLRLIAQQDDCAHIPLGICGCHPGPIPALNLILPLPNTVLTRPVRLPRREVRAAGMRAPALIISSEFLPVAFHPPRG